MLLGGGTFAAVSAIGEGNGHRRSHTADVARRLHRQDRPRRGPAPHGSVHGLGRFVVSQRLSLVAADYLGIGSERLRHDLQSGKTLAQVADATPGKSKAGLVDALVAPRRRRLLGRVSAGKLTPARAARRGLRLRQRMDRLVTHKFVRPRKP